MTDDLITQLRALAQKWEQHDEDAGDGPEEYASAAGVDSGYGRAATELRELLDAHEVELRARIDRVAEAIAHIRAGHVPVVVEQTEPGFPIPDQRRTAVAEQWCIVLDPFDLPTRVVGPFGTEASAKQAADEIYAAGDSGVAVVPLQAKP